MERLPGWRQILLERGTWMKRLLLSLSVIALFCAAGSAASAQGPDEFEKELQAFQQKAGVASAPQNNSGTAPSPAPPPASLAPPVLGSPLPVPSAGSNPLGPAANLPLGKPVPATAHALDMNVMQAPVETQADIDAKLAARKKKFEDQAFNQALEQIMPLSPEEIRKLYDAFRENRRASETPFINPKPLVRVEPVSLDPTQVPITINTALGRVTTLTVIDSTGAPWPIQDVSWAGRFDVTPPEEGGNVIRITPKTAHDMGNISMRLVDLITPVTFTLNTGIDVVDYRLDARMPKPGPLAKTPLIAHGGLKTHVGTDENLVQILDGTAPAGAEKLKVEGTDGRSKAWRISGRMYLRTPLTLLSPAWSSSVASADGMNVYVLDNAPVVLLSDEGRVVSASITSSEITP